MTDARIWCPACEPHVDQQEELVVVDWCEWHRPKTEGTMDALVGPLPPTGFILANGECEGIPNAAFCALVHSGVVR